MYYTTFEQSKQLKELGLPFETADMSFGRNAHTPTGYEHYPFSIRGNNNFFPCWSCGALLNILPVTIDDTDVKAELLINKREYQDGSQKRLYIIEYDGVITYEANELIYCLYEMVTWLLENKRI